MRAADEHAAPGSAASIGKNHEFYPAGAVMNPDGSVAFSATYDGSEHPSSREVIDFLVKEHKNLADQNKIKVSAIAYDACVPIAGKKTDCIIMNLEHQSGYSVTFGMPYSFSFFQIINYIFRGLVSRAF